MPSFHPLCPTSIRTSAAFRKHLFAILAFHTPIFISIPAGLPADDVRRHCSFQLGSSVGSSVGSISIVSTDSGDMPLSQLQIDALKTPTTVIEIQTDNPKKPGSKAAERFDRYKMATTIQEATNQGANWQDLSADFEKGYLKIRDIKPADIEMEAQGSTKRGAPEGTPDREADARSKLPSTAVVPRALAVEPVESGAKVEMSAATISALRSMMRDEIRYGMVEMEQRFSAKLSTAMGEIREELGAEKVARQQLEERLSHLEQQNMGEQGKHAPQNFEDEDVDKSVVVVGGFVEKSLADAEALVQEMMVGIKGYKDVDMIDVEPPLALARFDSPGEAMKFIRSQKKNATVQTNQLWASENRSRTERSRCKIVRKIKKYCASECHCQLQEFQGGGPPQFQIDSGGAGWSDFGGGVVGGLHCECSSA